MQISRFPGDFCHYFSNGKKKKNVGGYLPSICVTNGEFYFRDSDEVSKFDLGLLNAYNPMYFDRNISENQDDKKK